jgi:hypothetical protein
LGSPFTSSHQETTKGKKLNIPTKLYHAAPMCAVENIIAEGLKGSYGLVYAAGSPAEALTFMWFRLLDHAHHELVDGKVSFELVPHESIHVWEVDTDITGKKSWDGGADHAPSFFGGARSFEHKGDIPFDALTDCRVISREVILASMDVAKSSK